MKNSFSFSRYRLLKSKNSAGQILGFHRFPKKYCRAISVCDVTDDLCSEWEADVHTEPRRIRIVSHNASDKVILPRLFQIWRHFEIPPV